jgi:hypothetical protein
VSNLPTYIEELKNDTQINELNLKDKSLHLPALKGKWVARLINHKNTLNILERKKRNAIKDAVPRVKESLPVKLSDNYIKEKAEDVSEVITITKQIEEEKLIIDFLERTEKIISSMSYDLSNIIKIVQLETL